MNLLSFNNKILKLDYNIERNSIFESNSVTGKELELCSDSNKLMIFGETFFLENFKIISSDKLNLFALQTDLDSFTVFVLKYKNIIVSIRLNKNSKKEINYIKVIFPEKNSPLFLESLSIPIVKIEEGIYIGNLLSAIDETILENNNIKNIIHVFEDEMNSSNVREMNISIQDSKDENILEYFDRFFSFVNSSVGNILIHCQHGSSRSGSFMILYLMNKYKINFYNAFFLARFKRNGIFPNKSFCKQLINFNL